MSISTIPTFNLKVVLKETGLAADTLRAWERRYGLPMPERTPGGHRLYSQRDIEIIKWLMAKQREGLSISRAVDLWNELTASGQDPLPAPAKQVVSTPSANLDAVRQAWLGACLAFNENSAEHALNQAFATHLLETVCVEVMQRGLQEIGEMWYHNEATVQQEHFTSALAHRRLDAMIAASPPPTRPYTALIGCTAGEQHVFGPLLLTLFLRRRGLNVVYLGANVPTMRFNETLRAIRPHLVILSAQLLQTANELRVTAEQLRSSGARVAYGGRIFNLMPELRKRIPAHFLGESIPEALTSIETLLNTNIPLQKVEPVSPLESNLGKAFLRNRPMIDVQVLAEARNLEIPTEFALLAIQELGSNLASALALGNLEAVRAEMEWIQGLLHEYNQDHNSLQNFIRIYAQSIDATMGEEGQPLSSWLKDQST